MASSRENSDSPRCTDAPSNAGHGPETEIARFLGRRAPTAGSPVPADKNDWFDTPLTDFGSGDAAAVGWASAVSSKLKTRFTPEAAAIEKMSLKDGKRLDALLKLQDASNYLDGIPKKPRTRNTESDDRGSRESNTPREDDDYKGEHSEHARPASRSNRDGGQQQEEGSFMDHPIFVNYSQIKEVISFKKGYMQYGIVEKVLGKLPGSFFREQARKVREARLRKIALIIGDGEYRDPNMHVSAAASEEAAFARMRDKFQAPVML